MGIALIWLFRESSTGSVIVSSEFLPAAILIVIGLGLDLLQYVTGSAVWGAYHRLQERAGTTEEAEFEVPLMLNWPALWVLLGQAGSHLNGVLLAATSVTGCALRVDSRRNGVSGPPRATLHARTGTRSTGCKGVGRAHRRASSSIPYYG